MIERRQAIGKAISRNCGIISEKRERISNNEAVFFTMRPISFRLLARKRRPVNTNKIDKNGTSSSWTI